MLKIMKPQQVSCVDTVVEIPDYTPPPTSLPEQEQQEQQLSKEELAQLYSATLLRAQQQGEAQAQQILAAAQAQAQQLSQQAQLQAQAVLDQARQDGYRDGWQKAAGEADACIRQTREVLDQMAAQQLDFMEEYRDGIAILALEVANQLMVEQLQQNDLALLGLVKKAVESVKNADWISVEISSQLTGLAEELKKAFANQEEVSVKLVDGDLDHCVIQTPESVIDASVSTQLANLRKCFDKIK